MPTAEESNHSAAGMVYSQHSATCVLYITLHFPIPVTGDINP